MRLTVTEASPTRRGVARTRAPISVGKLLAVMGSNPHPTFKNIGKGLY